MSCSSVRTQPEPFSTGAIFSFGNRVHRPWPTQDAIVSMIARWCAPQIASNAPDLLGERRELVVAEAFPLVEVALVAAVGRVHADDDVGLLDELPERIELGQRERTPAAGTRGRARDGSG